MVYSSVTEKPCSRCKRVLPASMFNKAKWLRSGLRPDCKECYARAKKEAWSRKPKSEMALRKQENAKLGKQGLRRCKTCAHIKPRDEEHFSRAGGIWQPACRGCDRTRTRRWAKENEDRYKANAAAGCAKRMAAKRQRLLRLSQQHQRQMREIYAECRKRNKNNPRAWHVDHIVPLNGKTVSGLHVPWNLRIIPGSENVRKANRWSAESSWLGAGIAA